MIRVSLWGKGKAVGVTPNGEVLTRAFDYSDPVIKQLTDTTVTNLVVPISGEQYIMTGMFASADRSIGANGELLEIYESAGETDGTQTKLLFSIDIARQGNVSPPSVPGKITAGKFINVDRTNAVGTITVTIWGYFIPLG